MVSSLPNWIDCCLPLRFPSLPRTRPPYDGRGWESLSRRLIFLQAIDWSSILFRRRRQCGGGEANIVWPVMLFFGPCLQLEHVPLTEVALTVAFAQK